MSCVSTSKYTGTRFDSLKLTDHNTIKILPTEYFESELEMLQFVNGYYHDDKYSMQTILSMDNQQISVSAITAFGNTLYDITYNADSIEYNTIIPLNDISAVYMIADIQLCYYPVSSVREMLEDGGLFLEVTFSENGWVRKVYSENIEVISVKREGSQLEYQNHLRNYGYIIEEKTNE